MPKRYQWYIFWYTFSLFLDFDLRLSCRLSLDIFYLENGMEKNWNEVRPTSIKITNCRVFSLFCAMCVLYMNHWRKFNHFNSERKKCFLCRHNHTICENKLNCVQTKLLMVVLLYSVVRIQTTIFLQLQRE